MKTLVIYYSYSGKTKAIAENIAKEESADLIEVKEKAIRSKWKAYLLGCFEARAQKQVELQPFNTDFSAYDQITIAMPIWAGYPAPAINRIISLLPSGKDITLVMTSGSGSSKGSAENTKALVEAKGCRVIKYQDLRG